jgi:hypothetical protein
MVVVVFAAAVVGVVAAATGARSARGVRGGLVSMPDLPKRLAGSGASASNGIAKTRAGLAALALDAGTMAVAVVVVVTAVVAVFMAGKGACSEGWVRKGVQSVPTPAKGVIRSIASTGVAKLVVRRVPSVVAARTAVAAASLAGVASAGIEDVLPAATK